MEISYGTNKIKKQLGSASEIKKAFGELAKKIAQRLVEIKNSPTLTVLRQIPAARCHPLTADLDGLWAVIVSGNFRMIFEITHDPVPEKDDGSVDTDLVTAVTINEIRDYH